MGQVDRDKQQINSVYEIIERRKAREEKGKRSKLRRNLFIIIIIVFIFISPMHRWDPIQRMIQ